MSTKTQAQASQDTDTGRHASGNVLTGESDYDGRHRKGEPTSQKASA